MNSNLFILFSYFALACAGDEDRDFLPPLLGKIKSLEEHLAEELAALNSFAAAEDVDRYKNESSLVHGFGHSWIVLPDGNGTAKVAVLRSEEQPSQYLFKLPMWTFQNEEDEAVEKVVFRIYDKDRPDGLNFGLGGVDEIEINDKAELKIICHGWRSSGESDIIQKTKTAYLEEKEVTVIGVDWSYVAKSIMYNMCAQKTALIGKLVSKLINRIAENFEIPYENIHIVGHSLGAHIAGFAGRLTNSKIGRITGLDPALPGFQFFEVAGGRLGKNDALFVDVIHSCVSSLGMSVPIGHVDFYPNGGSPQQPGCPQSLAEDIPFILNTVSCSHARSYQFFEESIRKSSEFIGVKCETWAKFKSHECSEEFSKMGEYVNRSATGIFYLKTQTTRPFYLGKEGAKF